MFLLTQAMGGGKTHSMIALGLLAKHPELRKSCLSGASENDPGEIHVAGFTGRETDAKYGIWGAIAEQLGKKDMFNDHYSPLSALRLEPVGMNTGEVYHILRTRLFETLPERDNIKPVAEAYAQSVKDARQMDLTNASPEQYIRRIIESYPFHFSIRDLYARFRENPGFQQTRGLIRLTMVNPAKKEGAWF